jgi:integrase
MANRTVAIYESTTEGGKQGWLAVEIPEKKPDGSLYMKDNRFGNFHIRWYQGVDAKGRPKQHWKKVPATANSLPKLTQAITAKEAKEWELQHPERVKPDTTTGPGQISISAATFQYLENFAGSKLTIKGHRHALEEFTSWVSCQNVGDITRAMLLRWKDHLVRNGNDELTAVWKLIRINKFYKTILKLPHGAGLIKTTEFKSVLQKKPRIQVYKPEELQQFFAACDERQFVLFQLYYKCGLRNKELAHLEWDDVDLVRRVVEIRSKKAMKNGDEKKQWSPKHGSEGEVALPQDVVPLLEKLKEKARCNLLFPTRSGRVNIKLLDQCKLVATRAGLDPSKWKIKSLRSTYATSRLRSGYDIATVREQLRHKDSKSVEHYIDFLKNEDLIKTGAVDKGWDA